MFDEIPHPFQTATDAPLRFGNRSVIHPVLDRWLFLHSSATYSHVYRCTPDYVWIKLNIFVEYSFCVYQIWIKMTCPNFQPINLSRAEFISGTIKTFAFSSSERYICVAKCTCIVKMDDESIFLGLRPQYSGRACPIPWLLISRLLASPG